MPRLVAELRLYGFRAKTYIWHRVRISPHLLDPYSPCQIMGLEKNAEVVGMLYGFRITPPGFQEGTQTL